MPIPRLLIFFMLVNDGKEVPASAPWQLSDAHRDLHAYIHVCARAIPQHNLYLMTLFDTRIVRKHRIRTRSIAKTTCRIG